MYFNLYKSTIANSYHYLNDMETMIMVDKLGLHYIESNIVRVTLYKNISKKAFYISDYNNPLMVKEKWSGSFLVFELNNISQIKKLQSNSYYIKWVHYDKYNRFYFKNPWDVI